MNFITNIWTPHNLWLIIHISWRPWPMDNSYSITKHLFQNIPKFHLYNIFDFADLSLLIFANSVVRQVQFMSGWWKNDTTKKYPSRKVTNSYQLSLMSINMYKESDKRTLYDLNSNHFKTFPYHLSVIIHTDHTYCSVLFNQKRVTKMNLFSVIILHTFMIATKSMPTDMRSAFANMLHHTLYEKDGPLKG